MIDLDKIIEEDLLHTAFDDEELGWIKETVLKAIRQALELACKNSLKCATDINLELYGDNENADWEEVVMMSKIINKSIMSVMEEIE